VRELLFVWSKIKIKGWHSTLCGFISMIKGNAQHKKFVNYVGGTPNFEED
jgi:hypothetical protein